MTNVTKAPERTALYRIRDEADSGRRRKQRAKQQQPRWA
jgi:hypothetical protein